MLYKLGRSVRETRGKLSLQGAQYSWAVALRCDPLADVLLVIDLQAPLLDVIHERDRVIRRSCFIIEAARTLGIPMVATEQAPERLGSTEDSVRTALGDVMPLAKTAFSAVGCTEAIRRIGEGARRSVVVIGVETHICVCSTVLDLLALGYQATVCPDAASSRNLEAHKLGMERLRDAGAMPAHTESVVYEWLSSSSHPQFRTVLDLVKRYDAPPRG